MKKRHDDDGDDMTPEEKAEMKRFVDALLSSCDGSSQRVYVLELMRISKRMTAKGRFGKCGYYTGSVRTLLAAVKKSADRIFYAPVIDHKGIQRRSVALIGDPWKIESLGMRGETVWLRQVESDELFEPEDQWLLLRPREIVEIYSDFVKEALEQHLEMNGYDAQLAVIHAAGELLLAHLEEDIYLIPDRFGDVVEAIDAVLKQVDVFALTEDAVRRLADDVIQKVGLPS